MNAKKAIVSVFGGLSLLAGCDGAPEPGSASGSTNTDWQSAVAAYPYVGSHGETVCSALERYEDGRHLVDPESYNFAAMNAALAGEGPLGADLLAAIRAGGVTQVKTCDDARSFFKLKQDFIERDGVATDGLSPADTLDQAIDKVAEGNPSSVPYVVRVQPWDAGSRRFGTCSGVLIGSRALLTAAHCFGESRPTSFSQVWDVRVDFGRGQGGAGDASVNCISGGSSCSNSPSGLNASVFIFPGYLGGPDTERDLALVINKTAWADVNGPLPWTVFRPMTATRPGAGEYYWIDGYGAHASSGSETGIHALSKKNVTINDSYTGYWRDSVVKGSGRPCAGDSGSPAINTSRLTGSLVGPDLVIGLHSNADRPKTEACPSPGAYFRYTRLEDKLSFIKNTIAGIPGLTACTNGSKPGGWSYMICF